MKILVLSAGEDYTLGASYNRAFQRLGQETLLIDPIRLLENDVLWKNRLSRRLFERQLIGRFNRAWLSTLLEIPADLVFVGKGAWATPWLWNAYKEARPRTKLVCYNADDPITTYSRGGNRPWINESIGCFDLFCTYKISLIDRLRQHTIGKVIRVPFGWDPAVHPKQKTEAFEHDLVFVGNGDAHREQWLTKLVEAPCATRWRIAVYGKWGAVKSQKLRAAICRKPLYCVEMAKVLASSKVSVNILRKQNEGSHNMRTFEAPGCGGLTVSQYSSEQNDFFPEGEAAVYFSDMDDAALRIEQVIRDDRVRERMRTCAGEIVAQHTYVERAASVLEHVI